MKTNASVMGVLFLFSATAYCFDPVLDRILKHSEKVRSFEGTVEETWEPKSRMQTSEIFYSKPFFSSEITSIGPLKGSRICFADGILSVYYPKTKLAMEYKNLPSPSDAELTQLIKDRYDLDISLYEFTVGKDTESSGLKAASMKFSSRDTDFWISGGEAYVYDEYSFPLLHTISLKDAQSYTSRFKKIKFNTEISLKHFKCEIPEDSIFSEWDLNSANHPLKDVEKDLPGIKTPTHLLRDLKLEKIVRQRGPVAAFNLIYKGSPYYLFLTVVKDSRLNLIPDGPSLMLNFGHRGRLVFLSTIGVYNFSLRGISYTLTSNLPAEDLVAVADSIP